MTAPSPSVSETLTFRLGVLGALATARFTERLDALALKPKHVGLLALLDAGAPASQLELARTMGVAPSLMVTLADHLGELGAVGRERDPADRRRQVLTLTDHGRELLAGAARAASELDEELAASLTPARRTALDRALRDLAEAEGMPVT
ncbi:MarR family winged helix-turn-helix transcriptional regulator [Streptomyces sp. NPDC048172]|uniref:MarR family winged helix-turn-helix transcriptional regulator n=1 Tax=Streptomyces sp. NPDC048172 TaxID=3365505 RepID=UPI00371E8B45